MSRTDEIKQLITIFNNANLISSCPPKLIQEEIWKFIMMGDMFYVNKDLYSFLGNKWEQ